MLYPKPLQKLIDELIKLPGVGPKTAQRLAFFLLRQTREDIDGLLSAIHDVKEKITYCEKCFNITDSSPCMICRDSSRNPALVCVVEEPVDVLAIEKTREYKGIYHILQGVISPLDNVHPEDLRIKELLDRISMDNIQEVIVATNPSVEGETTAFYLAKLIKPLGVKVTRIAHGIPMGADLDYADEVTLTRALEGRREM